jgi:CBS domain-containing protein
MPNDVHRLPVVEDDHVIGVVSTRDLLAVAAGRA